MSNITGVTAREYLKKFAGKTFPALTKDEEDRIIARAVSGEEEAAEEMLARYWGLITKESTASHLRNNDLYADAFNIAILAFLEALKDYDATRGIPFAALARSKVHCTLYGYFRTTRRRWERTSNPEQDERAYDESCWNHIAGTEDIGEAVIENVYHQTLSKRIIKLLSPKEKRLLEQIFWLEIPQHKLAEILNISRQGVSVAKQRLLKRLRDVLTREGYGCAPA